MPLKKSLVRIGALTFLSILFLKCVSPEEKEYLDQIDVLTSQNLSPTQQLKKADSLITSPQPFTVSKERFSSE